MRQRVYLAGPISGLSYEQATLWRAVAANWLEDFGITCYSPMRGKKHLALVGQIEHDYPEDVLTTQRGIMCRDHNDVARADLVLANLRGVSRVSVGTVMELAWAFERGTPVVAILEAEGNPHDHPMVREAIDYRVTSLEHALEVTRSILCAE
jgi:nucleoside 2-deoxyribosyltransferase